MKRRFDFRLARLQRVREIEERTARAEWGRAEAQARAAAGRRAAIARELDAARRDCAGDRRAGVLDPARVLIQQMALDSQLYSLAAADEALTTQRAQAEALATAWREREQNRRALEELENRARVRHQKAVRDHENAEMDEIAVMRRARKDHSEKGSSRRDLSSDGSDA